MSGERRTDSGFSFVELLVALSILAISLVSLMSLASTSSFMVSSSRQRAAMANAAAGYLDRARQAAFSDVGTPGGDPAGTLASQSTTSAPFVITVTPAVTWGRIEDPSSHDLKTVTLTITSQGLDGGSQMTMSASAVLADIGAVGAPISSSPATPNVAVVTPVDGSVVWGSAASVTASAAVANPSTQLVWMDIVDGVQSWGATAVTGRSAQHTWTWNTTSAREGKHRLTPRVTDNSNTTVDGASIVLTVDNLAPTVPGSPGSAYGSGSTGSVWWSAATDGTDVDGATPLPASHYLLSLLRQPIDTALAADYTKWSPVAGLTALSTVNVPPSTAPLGLSGLTGFTRYAAAIMSSSPDRGAASGSLSAPATTLGITESTAQGTWAVSNSGGKYTVTTLVNVPVGPTFPWSGTATTRIYRLTSATQAPTSGTLLATLSSAYPTWSTAAATDTQSKVTQPAVYYYAAVTTITPLGFGSASTTVKSCVLAPPADRTTTGTRQLVIAQW